MTHSRYRIELLSHVGAHYKTFYSDEIIICHGCQCIRFSPINEHNIGGEPKEITVHMTNCIIYDMKGSE